MGNVRKFRHAEANKKYLFWKNPPNFWQTKICEISTPIAFLQLFGGVIPIRLPRWVFGRENPQIFPSTEERNRRTRLKTRM